MNKELTLSVHQLVDFLLRSGSIDTRVFNKASMSEGVRLHAFYQSRQGNEYLSEYFLRETFFVDEYNLTLEGRADGIIVTDNEYIIDEIKSTVIDIDEFHRENENWHLGQAQCYALMLAHERIIDQVKIRLTYIHQTTNEQKIKEYIFSTHDLEDFVTTLIRRYLNFYNTVYRHEINRNASMQNFHFPFSSFRKGQKKLAQYTYAMTAQGGVLYAEAPTGIGKTMSTLYPAISAFAREKINKIFYLTAKTSGQDSAHGAMEILKKSGADVFPIVITAKDRICFNPGKGCNPDECPYARNYYNKIQDALLNALLYENDFSKETIIKLALENEICPFEFQLDLSLFCDVIICDYNYLFDPLVYLRRYFETGDSSYFALIDEAHNLIERVRDMYSSELNLEQFISMQKHLRKLVHPHIKTALRRLIKNLRELNSLIADKDSPTIIDTIPSPLLNNLNLFLLAGQDVMKNHVQFADEPFKELFFNVNRFMKIWDYYSSEFRLFIYRQGKSNLILKNYNLNPSNLIRNCLGNVFGSVIFSATLSPIDYYVNLLGGSKDSPRLILPNPFPRKNRRLLIAPDVRTTYRKRDTSYGLIADYIQALYSKQIGNYICFFPSYEYLNNVKPFLEDLKEKDDFILMAQDKEMSRDEQEVFLSKFVPKPQKTRIGLAVLGGAFSEGIDLVDDRLIGVVIVGVGLPQISFERDLIRKFYDEKEISGFEYSYVNPGMNRVMQAVGRLIRSENDRGIALLLDERYLQDRYRHLFKTEWDDYEVVTSPEDVKNICADFWKIN